MRISRPGWSATWPICFRITKLAYFEIRELRHKSPSYALCLRTMP